MHLCIVKSHQVNARFPLKSYCYQNKGSYSSRGNLLLNEIKKQYLPSVRQMELYTYILLLIAVTGRASSYIFVPLMRHSSFMHSSLNACFNAYCYVLRGKHARMQFVVHLGLGWGNVGRLGRGWIQHPAHTDCFPYIY